MKMLNIVAAAVGAVSAAGAALWGAGVAGAQPPDVVGHTYNDATKMIEEGGGTPVIATRTGTGADEGDCLVTNAWNAPYMRPGARGRPVGNNEVLVALNCNGELAAAGTPGNSAASPTGREAKAAQEQAAAEEEQELAEAATPGA